MHDLTPELPFDLGNGRYHVTALIAEGGTARVYVCYDTAERAWRAVKLLLPEYAMRADLRKRLIVEAHAMMRLDHPHILRVFEANEDEEQAYFVMEYAERGSVGDWVEEHGPLPDTAAIEVISQVCDAVRHAHASGVIHRDIKPHNILVDGRGVCTVADFGIAQVTWQQRHTKTGAALGTLGYLAPEQMDSAKHVDGRADIYSIAATLYMLVVGQSPRDLFMAKSGDPLFAPLHPAIERVIVRGTRHRREQRHDHIDALLEDLERARFDLTPPGEVYPLFAPPAPPAPPRVLPGSFASNPHRIEPPTFNLDSNMRTVKPASNPCPPQLDDE